MSRKERIQALITETMQPSHLAVMDESHMHAVPAGAESHFKLVVVSNAFDGESLIKRHRKLNALLSAEFEQGLHALAIHAFTPSEWRDKGEAAPASPKCRGGSKAKPGTATQADAAAPA
ncbi:BolA family protein [Thiorhodovibrio frisius]|uniref:Stress-induced morphogen n=1 Tax=Thiorhodovibrio frisius TaxID=631362 RepID=H8Z362_9GAMM|nr:BolA family protein [Thiorhodovibrio frisius]EIC21770.1 stress-induced morphogen [Thiorhodovibrio frisius]WPL21736.1 transcriptional regulator BolA [Thiorhodovibrio frisius]